MSGLQPGFSPQELAEVRAQFPMLQQPHPTGKPFIYLNSAATSLKPHCVLEAMDDYYRHYGLTVFRGVDSVSYRATEAYEETRRHVARFIHAPRAEEVIFTRNTTAALNLVCHSYAGSQLQEGDEILVGRNEHHANFLPWQQLAKQRGLVLKLLDLDERGRVLPESLEAAITERSKLFTVAQCSNVMGAQADIKALAEVCHRHGLVIVVDGAQGILHGPTDVQELGIDFYAFSGHKLFGPTGVGVLWGRYELLEAMPPHEYGGEMIDQVGDYDSSFADPPHRFEAGTPMIAEVIGLNRALTFVEELGYARMNRQVAYLGEQLSAGLAALPRIQVYNRENSASGIVCFNEAGVHAHDAASVFDQEGISLRAGQHCSQSSMDWLCTQATLRASVACFNTEAEIEACINCAQKAGNFLDVLF